MKVSRERLSVIGRMIGIYREERRGNSQNNWTQIKFCDNICSPNTLKNIESGGIARSQELYEKLLEKLDLKLGEFPVIDEAVEKLINELYIAIEYFDNTKIDSLTSKGVKILGNAREYVYYSELLEIFTDIRKYYLHDENILFEKMSLYLSEIEIFSKKLSNILRILLFAVIKLDSMDNIELYNENVLKLEMDKSDYSCIQMMLLHFYFVNNKFLRMNQKLEELEKHFIDTNNLTRLIDIYDMSILMLGKIDDDVCCSYIEKLKKIVEENNVSETKKAEVYSNIAAYYYDKSDYNNALEYFEKIPESSKTQWIPNLIHIADCQKRLKLPVSLPNIDKNSFKKYPSNIKIMYNYFLIDENVPPFIKMNYIMKKVLPTLKDDCFIKVFRNELESIVEKTNSYKKLYIFDKTLNTN